MDKSLYIAMSGAKQTLLAQTANANNLAHAQTTGFKSDLEQFRSMPVFGSGFPTRVYAMTERPGTDLSPGSLQSTGRELDVAVDGEGWLAVQDAEGNEAYSRAGDLNITPEGLLQNGAGSQILGQDGPVSIPPSQKLEIGKDGTISIIPLGSRASNLVVIDRIKLVKPAMDNLEKGNDGLMRPKDGKTETANPDVTLVQGALEGSNVNSVGAMVEMIELAKNFELQTKVMKDADENARASAKLMQMA
jgi:flagellar basal-body rod protein FlgF